MTFPISSPQRVVRRKENIIYLQYFPQDPEPKLDKLLRYLVAKPLVRYFLRSFN